MKLIVGLGNPGMEYADSRHNVGFEVIKCLAKTSKAVLKRDFGTKAFSAKLKIGPQQVILSIPMTFMNLSGLAVKQLIKKYKVEPGNLLVVCDDLDLELGRIKIRPSGSSGGQKGVQSIFDSLGTPDFARLRIGIGRPKRSTDACDYVLSQFSRREKEIVGPAMLKAAECCLYWVRYGIEKTMNNFNKKELSE